MRPLSEIIIISANDIIEIFFETTTQIKTSSLTKSMETATIKFYLNNNSHQKPISLTMTQGINRPKSQNIALQKTLLVVGFRVRNRTQKSKSQQIEK